ncbi:hypothetical protein G6F35_017984 [Rhizopus arrhizus]|nr:hypothetical protein G6F23_016094 [Rhizopus arrhizus]KAG1166809.1 hypothetical protein G6F35_017984 [Rhizopus arrhizus]KAG1388610.1 hypothetical protein G6F58_013466 [Rhizopus delemar]
MHPGAAAGDHRPAAVHRHPPKHAPAHQAVQAGPGAPSGRCGCRPRGRRRPSAPALSGRTAPRTGRRPRLRR